MKMLLAVIGISIIALLLYLKATHSVADEVANNKMKEPIKAMAQITVPTNRILATQIRLEYRVNVRIIKLHVGTANVGKFINIGVYTENKKSLLLESGAIFVDSAGMKEVALNTPIKLEPGVYWYAWFVDAVDMKSFPPTLDLITNEVISSPMVLLEP